MLCIADMAWLLPAPTAYVETAYFQKVAAETMAELSRATEDLSIRAEEAAYMRRIGAGDAKAYRVLADRHLRPILRFAERLLGDPSEAEDVAQETFLRMWQQAGQWQPQARISTWLHRVAHNLCIDRLRRRRPGEASELERLVDGDRPSGLLARKQLVTDVHAALQALPERQRTAIVLVHYQGMSQGEAAEVLACGIEALESLLARARRGLREQLASVHTAGEGEGL